MYASVLRHSRRILLLFSIGLSALAPDSIRAASYDLSASFSASANPSGAWSYGWEGSVGGAFTPYSSERTNPDDNGRPVAVWFATSGSSAFFCNTTGTVEVDNGGASQFPPGTTYWAAGAPGQPDDYGAIRFTLPAGQAGNYNLAVNLGPAIAGSVQGAVIFYLVQNGVPIFTNPVASGQGISVTDALPLQDGDTLDLLVGRGLPSTSYGDVNVVEATLTPTSSTNLGTLIASITNSPPTSTSTNSTPPVPVNPVPPAPAPLAPPIFSATNSPPPPAGTYDLDASITSTNDPNGAWSYGWEGTVGGAFTLYASERSNPDDNGRPVATWFTTSGSSAFFCSTTGTTEVDNGGASKFAPGTTYWAAGAPGAPDYYGAIRFTLPAGQAGNYNLAVNLSPAITGPMQGAMNFFLVQNGVPIFTNPVASGQGISVTDSLALQDGDTLDLLLGRALSFTSYGDVIVVEATLTATSSTNLGTFIVSITNSPPTSTPTNSLPPVPVNPVPPAPAPLAPPIFSATNSPPPPAGTYDLDASITSTNDPNSAWSYGWEGSVGGAFTLYTSERSNPDDNGRPVSVWFTTSGSSAFFCSTTGTTEVDNGGASKFAPGITYWAAGAPGQPDYYGAIRFTLPAGQAGNYNLAVSLSPAITGPLQGAVDFYLLQNGVPIYTNPVASGQGISLSDTLSLQDGDTVDFLVGRAVPSSSYGDVNVVEATLTATSSTNVGTIIVSITNSPPSSAPATPLPPIPAPPFPTPFAPLAPPVFSATNSPPPPAGTYDLAASVVSTSDPNGAWSCGWEGSVGGTFSLYSLERTNPDDNRRSSSVWFSIASSSAFFCNTTGTNEVDNGGASQFPPGTTYWAPGAPGNPDYYGAIRFTLPSGQAGDYNLMVNLGPAITGPLQGPVDFYLVQNGAPIFTNPVAPGQGLTVTDGLALQDGDTLDLLVGRGIPMTSYGDVVVVEATLTATSAANLAPLAFSVTNPPPAAPIAMVPPSITIIPPSGITNPAPPQISGASLVNARTGSPYGLDSLRAPTPATTGAPALFQFMLNGAANQNYTVEFAANSISSGWTALLVTNNPATNQFKVVVPYATNSVGFYRVKVGP